MIKTQGYYDIVDKFTFSLRPLIDEIVYQMQTLRYLNVDFSDFYV